ncbi:MAG TPA: response regulator [Longimicrobiaceae bacterium]|nr:response regulator [Longimicrobiaceae bacterium]
MLGESTDGGTGGGAGAGPTILVVDDSEAIRLGLQIVLRLNDYRVLLARDGGEGVRMAAEERPALVLLDMMMPGVDGPETVRQLRADPRTRRIPLVAITATVGHTPEELRGLGFDSSLRKPFGAERLLEVIEALLPVPASSSPCDD